MGDKSPKSAQKRTHQKDVKDSATQQKKDAAQAAKQVPKPEPKAAK